MSKITFRADDDLVDRLEALDASKSEVMREALRAYLDGADRDSGSGDDPASDASDAIGDALVDTIDSLVAERLDRATRESERRGAVPDVNLNVTVEGAGAGAVERSEDTPSGARERDTDRKTQDATAGGRAESRCGQCGELTDEEHVYCPNCGEKSSHRVFCECGDELRSDWAFCPGCGRRTPAADVLDRT